MKGMKRIGMIAAFLAASVAWAALADTFSLQRQAKVGDELTYRFTASFQLGSDKIEISGETLDRVTAVSEDGTITYRSTQRGLTVRTPDAEQKIEEESVTEMVIGADRVLKSMGSAVEGDTSSIRLGMLATIRRPDQPVKVGDKWSATIPPLVKDISPVQASYEILGTEKIGDWETVKIKLSARETEGDVKASSEGTVWISIADGSSVREQYTIKNAPIALMMNGTDMTISIERQK